jgi:imidazolonepropionase-like amidohydrolase
VPARLVTGGCDDSGSRIEIRAICSDDGLWVIPQQYTGPELAVYVATHRLALGGKTAIDHNGATRRQQRCEISGLCVSILFMHRLNFLFCLPFVLFACEGSPPTTATLASVPFDPDNGSIAVRCGTLIDGLADDAVDSRIVIIRDGRFERIDSGDAGPPADLPYLDLAEYTCLPGLINTHVHLADLPDRASDYSIYYRLTDAENTRTTAENAEITLLTGFTTVRNVGDYFPEFVYEIRDQIRAGEALGPRIRTAGPYLTIPGGGGDMVLPGHDESEIPAVLRTGVASTPEEFEDAARRAVANGADFLKVLASGAVFSYGIEPGAPEMHQDDIEAVVKVAREHGLKVTAHVHSAQSGKDAVLAGVDSLEHASLLDDEAIDLVAEHGVTLSMDVYNGTYTENVGRDQGYPEHMMQRNFDTTEAQRIVFEKAHARGIRIVYGTDGAVLPHHMGGWQFGIMVERGMAPMDALRSAMSVAADHVDMPEVGAVEVGRLGDLVAVRGNPLEDQEVMKDVAVVIKGGLAFKLPTE